VSSKSLFSCLDHFTRWWPLWFATALTTVFVWWTCTLALQVTVQSEISARRWDHFLSGRTNELGDTLAGFVGSLTLIWVIASVFQQSMELRAQRREFTEMAAAQSAQVDALKAQTAILVDEKTRRDQVAADQYVEEHLKTVARVLSDRKILLMTLNFRLERPEGATSGPDTFWKIISEVGGEEENYEKFLYDVGTSLEINLDTLKGIQKRGGQLLAVPDSFYNLSIVIGSASEIERLWDQLSLAFREKVFRSKVIESGNVLKQVFSILGLDAIEAGNRK